MDDDEIEEFERFIELEMDMLKKVDDIAKKFVEERRKRIEYTPENTKYGMPDITPNVANHGNYIIENYMYSREESA